MLSKWKKFWSEEDAMGTVEIVLIIVVLVGLALVFRTQISGIVDSIISKIKTRVNTF